MEFLDEAVITELGLTPQQVEGMKPKYESHLAGLKQGWDTKANTDAENIIAGAITSTAAKFKIDLPREAGEKNADYLARLNEKVVETQQANVTALENDYKQKLKDFDGGKGQKEELEKLKGDLDAAQLKLADYDDLKAKADKVETLETDYKSLKDKVFFQNEKPAFPDTANKFEVEARWGEFMKNFHEKWNIEFGDNGESIAVAKDNPHLKKKLSELVSADENLTALMEGRKQTGTGAHGTSKKIDGLDFELELPENPTSEDISKAINGYLDKQNIPKTSKERTKKFMEINTKVMASLKK